jgi:hypothetical protein
MVICTNLNNIIGSLFISVSYVVLSYLGGRSHPNFSIFMLIGNTLMFLSLGLNIFIYFVFNKIFRSVLKGIIKRFYKFMIS